MEKKRKSTQFKWSEDDWEHNPHVIDDIKYIKRFIANPELYQLEYDGWFDFHLNNAFRLKYGVSYSAPESEDKIKKNLDILLSYYNKVIGTDVEPFAVTLSDYAMKHCIALGDIDDFFVWLDKIMEVKYFNPHHYNIPFRDEHLSMKYIYHRPVTNFIELLGGYQITSSGNELTRFGKEHIEEVLDEAQRIFTSLNNPYIIDSFVTSSHTHYDSSFRVNYPQKCKVSVNPYSLCLYTDDKYIAFIKKTLREAENIVRKKYKLKNVGEGWVAEMELYNQICKMYPNKKIIHGYRAKWLGLQHLDIYIEDDHIGIEYQGVQHFKAIDHFGGKQGLKANKTRDANKVSKCKKNNCGLIWVCKDYNVNELKALIDSLISTNKKGFHIIGVDK